ncbi:hypothetical protein LP420_06810 [Massilia sp. B-10]|nr:hypothetical protein LP420_06810 [Massilia sp. B-10]
MFPQHYGTTATSLPFIGGQITAEELQRGEIRHAMGIALVDAEHFSIKSWLSAPLGRIQSQARRQPHSGGTAPAARSEGRRRQPRPASGRGDDRARPRNMVSLYGTRLQAISLRLQNPKSSTARGAADPYPALFKGTSKGKIMDGFPWDRLQFLPQDYGKPQAPGAAPAAATELRPSGPAKLPLERKI